MSAKKSEKKLHSCWSHTPPRIGPSSGALSTILERKKTIFEKNYSGEGEKIILEGKIGKKSVASRHYEKVEKVSVDACELGVGGPGGAGLPRFSAFENIQKTKLKQMNPEWLHSLYQTPLCQAPPICNFYQSVSETPFADLTDVTLADDDTNSILADDVNLELSHLDGGWAQCGVSKVGVQELHGMLEMVCWGGNGCHWDGGERVGWQGVAKGRKGGHQWRKAYSAETGICIRFSF